VLLLSTCAIWFSIGYVSSDWWGGESQDWPCALPELASMALKTVLREHRRAWATAERVLPAARVWWMPSEADPCLLGSGVASRENPSVWATGRRAEGGPPSGDGRGWSGVHDDLRTYAPEGRPGGGYGFVEQGATWVGFEMVTVFGVGRWGCSEMSVGGMLETARGGRVKPVGLYNAGH